MFYRYFYSVDSVSGTLLSSLPKITHLINLMVPVITAAVWKIDFRGARVESSRKGRVTYVIGILGTLGFPFYISLLSFCAFFFRL